MDDYVTLLGTEKIQQAGHNIASAAETIRGAALQMNMDFVQQREFMTEWLEEFRRTMEAHTLGEVKAE